MMQQDLKIVNLYKRKQTKTIKQTKTDRWQSVGDLRSKADTDVTKETNIQTTRMTKNRMMVGCRERCNLWFGKVRIFLHQKKGKTKRNEYGLVKLALDNKRESRFKIEKTNCMNRMFILLCTNSMRPIKHEKTKNHQFSNFYLIKKDINKDIKLITKNEVRMINKKRRYVGAATQSSNCVSAMQLNGYEWETNKKSKQSSCNMQTKKYREKTRAERVVT